MPFPQLCVFTQEESTSRFTVKLILCSSQAFSLNDLSRLISQSAGHFFSMNNKVCRYSTDALDQSRTPLLRQKKLAIKKNQIAIDRSTLISFSLFHCNYSSRNSRCFLVIAGRPAGVTATRGASHPFFLSPSSSLHDQGQL